MAAPPNSCTCTGAHYLLAEKPLKQLPATFNVRIPMKPAMHSDLKPATRSDLKPATWRAFRRVEKMLFLFFALGQAREARSGKSGLLWHGERPSR